MAFCSGAMPAVKAFVAKIDDVLDGIISEIQTVTGAIKKLETNPTVEGIVAAIPGGSAVEGYLNKGLDLITGVADDAKTLADKLTAWLNGKTQLEIDGDLIKLAAVSTNVAHTAVAGTDHPQSFYDDANQLHNLITRTTVADATANDTAETAQ